MGTKLFDSGTIAGTSASVALLSVALSFGAVLTGCGKKPAEAASKRAPALSSGTPQPNPETPEKTTTVFSSFSPDGSYDTRAAWAVVDASSEYRRHPERFHPDFRNGVNVEHGYRGQAEWFVPDTSGKLDRIQVALGRNSGLDKANISITEDQEGIPGAVLEVLSNVVCSAPTQAPRQPVSLASRKHPLLSRGQKYWLCVEPAEDGTSVTWFYNNQRRKQGFAYERSQGAWDFVAGGPENGAFNITVRSEE